MQGWIARVRLWSLLTAAAGTLSACYKAPEPDCGFVCGPMNACPEDYTCATDGRCHRNGTPASLVCGVDAGVDARVVDSRVADADLTAPTVMATSPLDNASNVDVTSTIVVTF